LKKFIPVNRPLIHKSDINAIIKTLKDGWISSEGPNVSKFEYEFSKFIGHKYGIAVSNGTAALEVAVQCLNLPKNSEIIIPNFTIFSNAIACLKNNLKIKPVDCDIFDWNMNLKKLINSITPKTKAIIVTHIYNFPMQMDEILKICKKKNIFIIEDASEVVGQLIHERKCGSFGDISTYSFYANKQITTGEGGMITTNSLKFYNKAKNLRNLSFGIKNRFNHDDISSNNRMSNIQATLGLNQLKRINSIIKKRHLVGRKYYELLKNNNNIFIQRPFNSYSKNIYWVIAILIKNKLLKINAKIAMKKLNGLGIGTRPFFWPIHKQRTLKNYKFYNSKNFKNSEYISNYGFYLPTSLDLTNEEIEYICKCVNDIFK